MPRTDDGEFELIMGNRQLLSVFFLVVFLLGVFFFLGYVVGRSSGPATQPEMAKTRTPLDIPAAGSSSSTTSASAPAEAKPSESKTATAEPSPEETRPSPVPAQQKKAEEPVAAAKPVPEAKPVVAAASSPVEPNLVQPEPGSVYVQVAATTRAEAFLVAESVGRKGHPAVVAQIAPNNPTYRVLVGPLPPKDNTAIAKVKGDMEALGFRPFVQKFKDTK